MSGTLNLNGTISANGSPGNNDFGGGSGGSVLVDTSVLTGTGHLEAKGGNAEGASGGGGRIAVHYVTGDGFSGYASSSAAAGSGSSSGQVGTTAFIRKDGDARHLRIFESMYYPEVSRIEYDTLTLENGAVLTVDGDSTISVGDLTLNSSSTLYLKGAYLDSRVGGTTGTWAGKGVTILADNLRAETGSLINADGQGYTAAHSGKATAGGREEWQLVW